MDADADPLSLLFAALLQVADVSTMEQLVTPVVAFFVLLFISAIVSGSEVALLSLDAPAKESLAKADDKASRRVLALLEKPRQLLITILLTNTLINVSAAILAALITKDIAENFEHLSEGVVFSLEVIALTFVLLVVGEITPKLIASRHAITYSRIVSQPLKITCWICYPIVAILAMWIQKTEDGLYRWFLRDTPETLSSEDLKMLANVAKESKSLGEDERQWIHSIVDFADTPVRTIMINRIDIIALPFKATMPEVLDIIRESGRSRLPVFKDHLDNIEGIVYAKDLLRYIREEESNSLFDWTQCIRDPMFVPHGKKLDELLKDFQQRKTHLSIVVDEYGGTAGLVTLEDVLEQVVGDIRDERDKAKNTYHKQLGDNLYDIDARIDLDSLNELLNFDIEPDAEDFEFGTLGGLILHQTGHIPNEGDTVTYKKLEMTVGKIINNRIQRVRVRILPT